ncbi:MAG: nitroreductase family protein [Flavobacteriales bacterium]|jgi:nitroreductase
MKYNLSEITEVIRQRRSLTPEQFSTRKVHKEQVELMLNNAIWAPTHGLTQPWRFKVFMGDSREKLSEILPALYQKFTPEETFKQAKFDKMKQRPLLASVVIAVCMERDKSEKIAEIEEVEAVACAVQNLQLTATAYGIGAFWATPKVIYSKEMNEFLKLGEKDKCLGLIYLGYTADEWPKAHRKPLEYVTEWME